MSDNLEGAIKAAERTLDGWQQTLELHLENLTKMESQTSLLQERVREAEEELAALKAQLQELRGSE
jgi:septal ring factor EnvC (AmiA/AmiB activator)